MTFNKKNKIKIRYGKFISLQRICFLLVFFNYIGKLNLVPTDPKDEKFPSLYQPIKEF